MKKYPKFLRFLPWFYLGFSIAQFTKHGFTTWQFYAIIVPFIILIELFDRRS